MNNASWCRLISAALDAAVVIDVTGTIQEWNSAATELFGWSASEAIGRPLAEVLVPERNRQRLIDRLSAYSSGAETQLHVRRLRTNSLHRRGHEFPVEISIAPVEVEGTLLLAAYVRDIRQQIAETEERGRLAAIVESSTDAIIGKDLEGIITSWNSAAETVYGYSAEEAIGHSVSIIIPDGLPEEVPELREALTAGKTLQSVEVVRRRKDGQLIDVSVSVSPIRDAAGQIVGTATIERDVSGELANHLALEEREEQIRMLLESTAEAIYGVDLDGNCTFCNPSCVRLLGYDSTSDLIGRNMHALIHHHRGDGTEYPVDECPIYQVCQSNTGTHVEDEVLWRADGSSFPAEYWSYPIRHGDRVCGAVVTFLDISDRLAAERDRLRLAALVESSVDAIIGLDLNSTIETWNDAAQRVFGWTAAEAIGKSVDLFLAEGRGSVIHDAVEKGKRMSQREVRCRRRESGEFSAALTLSPIRDIHDRHIGASIIARDMTKRKQREKALKEATTAAQAANRAKSEFLANISHELRTPMNAIIGMLELALSESLTDVMQDYLGTARDAAQTLLYLLNDLLDFSRIEAGRFELDPEPFSLRTTLDQTAKTLSVRAQEKGLELLCRISPEVPDILEGDAMRLRQVVTNLVSNAIKFTDSGEVTINAGIADEAEDSAIVETSEVMLHFTVSDTGVGISKEDQQRIFAPFTQADTSSTRRFQGTGLGLTICRELVERMGGRIWVESEPGQGSHFHFTARFPVIRSSRPLEAELRLTVAELRNTRVLVVDDNVSNCRILEETLKQWRMRPFVAHSAEVALKELRRSEAVGHTYPVVLVDALMPDMDGFMLLEAAHRENLLGDSTVLMLSSADRQSLRERCEAAAVTRYLEKPVSQSDLLEAVTSVLRGAGLEFEERTRMRVTSHPLRLLVAEDTRANQKVVRAILEKRGHEVHIAENGQDAVELLKKSSFDVVLMDIQMPVMDGYQATKLIRESDDRRVAATPIVAMTAHALREDMERCLSAGMNAYVAKPLEAEKLIRVTESTARRRRRTARSRGESGSSRVLRIPPENATQDRDGSEGWSDDSSVDARVVWTTEPAVEAFDRKAALKRMGGDESILRELMQCFVEDAPGLLKRLDDAVADNDAVEIARAAHSLKGLASTFEANHCREAAIAVESAARQNRLSELPSAVSRLRWQVEVLIQGLKVELD